MTLPIINFKSTNVEADETVQDIVTQKLTSLEKFIGEEADVVIDVEFEKAAGHQSGRIFRVEANITLKGTLYRAEATEASFEAAVDEVRDELDKELSRAHDKAITTERAEGREMKERLHGEI